MSIFVQEVLGLLKRNQKKVILDKNKDWFEFGKLYQSSNLNTGASYNPKMDPFVIKWGDIVCQVTEDMTRTLPGQGNLGYVPVYTDPSGFCSWDTLKDSIITQNALNTTINIAGSLTVTGTSNLNGDVNLGDAITDDIRLYGTLLDNAGNAPLANQVLVGQTDGSALWGASSSLVTPKVLVALVIQTGLIEPTMEIIYDHFAGTVIWTWSYISPGLYRLGASQPVFIVNKTALYIIPDVDPGKPYCGAIERTDASTLLVNAFLTTGASEDNLFARATLKIEIYP